MPPLFGLISSVVGLGAFPVFLAGFAGVMVIMIALLNRLFYNLH